MLLLFYIQSNLFSQLKDTQDPMSQDTLFYSANYALCIIEFGSGQLILILMFILYTITILLLFYSITMILLFYSIIMSAHLRSGFSLFPFEMESPFKG